jgi:hypothetical protein
MATKKAIVLTSGLFGELNTPTDKLDFAGNSTTDLFEGTNLYYTDARARLSISVTDTGGDGSLTYDNTTGVITYTGPSASEVRAHLSATTSGTGFGNLAYNSSTGVFTYTVVTSAEIRQQISVTDTGGDGSLAYDNSTGVITYTGPTAAEVRAHLSVAVGSGLTYNATTGEFGTSAIPNAQLANSSVTLGSTTVALGATATTIDGLTAITSSAVNVGALGTANSILLDSSGITFEGSGVDAFETTLSVVNPTAVRSIVFPDAGGTVALLTSLSVAAGSGLTYNSTTGEFGTSNIPNAQLQNSSVTIGSTSVALGGTTTSLAGLLSVTSAAVITDDGGFRIRNTTDNTKQIAFNAANISTSTVRTLSVPNEDGTLALLEANNAFIGINSFINSSGQSFRPAPLQDGFIIQGRAGGTDNYSVTFVTNTLTGNRTATFPNLTGTVLLDTSTIPGGTFVDDTFRISDNSDGTKKLAFECSGITTATTRTMTIPDESGTISTQDFATAIAIALG